ncbi:thioredoxin reductase-like protein 1 [Phlyctema vagabunda]|uniref:Thioredoxin reductase-like protein 1 n=1 Tax=Phlyctema vagabunda TaxID=108571 RepID=A0ABR4PG79_9HELO
MAATGPLFDVLIIGGGPGGLSTATGLARQLYTAVVFDSGLYRNARAHYMHNVATWDHRSPAEFRAKARDDLLARYETIRFEDIKINNVAKMPSGTFQATDAAGKVWEGRKLVLATGVRDVPPDIDGYHCLFCHGYEERGAASAGVLAIGDMGNVFGSLHLARMAKRLAVKVTIYSDGDQELGDQIKLSAGQEIEVDNRRITRLHKGLAKSEVVMTFEGGEQVTQAFVAHKPKTEINGPFAQQLALELTDQGDIKTTQPFHESSVHGVFAVGDCATPLKAVSMAMSTGGLGAGGLAMQLQSEPRL